jgi:RNA methyltransferase, TrmH family
VTTGEAAQVLITSAANPLLKLMRSLSRRKSRQTERAFLVEGRRLVEEAARDGHIRHLLVRDDVPQVWVEAQGIDSRRIRRVRADVFDDASEVEHAQGIAAICDLPEPGDLDLAHPDAFVLMLDRIRDPGNLGTALRSAAAAGVTTVLTSRGSVDPFSPKVVRAGMGAHFRLTLDYASPVVLASISGTGRDIVHADASAAVSYTEFSWREAVALVVGGETESLSPEMAAIVTRTVAIPMRAGIDSLNAGVAASVLLFEVQRQGRI